MKSLIIHKTLDTPDVILDPYNNKFLFSGCSLPYDAVAFYEPVFDWINKYSEEPGNNDIVFEFKLEYFNTNTSKALIDLFSAIEEKLSSKCKVLIKWYYEEGDNRMKEDGEEYAEITNLNFEIKESIYTDY